MVSFSCKTSKDKEVTPQKSKSYEEATIKTMYHDALKYKMKGDREKALEYFQALQLKDKDNSAVYFELSRIYDSQGSFVKALENGEKARELDPENKWYLHWIAILYKKNSYYKKAADAFGKLVENDPKNLDYLIAWSEVLYLSGQREKTVEAYNMLEEVYGQEPEVIVRRYQLLMELERFEEAVEDLELLISLDPANGQYYQMLAETYEKMGMPDKATEIYEQMAALEGSNSKISLIMAQKYFEQGEDEKGIQALIRVYEDEEVDIDRKVQLLLTLYELEAAEKVPFQEKIKELLDILEKKHPEEAKTYSIYGDYYLQKEDYSNAREKFIKALEYDQSRFPIWNQVLLLSFELNDFESMYQYGEQALTLFPSQPVVYLYKGIGALQTNRYDEAISTLNTGKDLVFNNDELKAEFFQNMGDAYYKKGEFNDAFKNYDRSLELNPDNGFLLNNYSYYLSEKKMHLDKAEEMAKKANNLIPEQPSFMDTYGWVFFNKGKYDEAIKWIEKAAQKDPKSSTILEHYGDVLFKLGRVDEAVSQWKKAQQQEGASEILEQKIKDRKYHEQ